MPPRTVEAHPKAVEEAMFAVEWYREQSSVLADGFLVELDHAVEQVTESPKTWPRYIQGTRHFLMRRFPFAVVYREGPNTIRILAVAHGKRKPGYWKGR